jgi:hypothetical protein
MAGEKKVLEGLVEGEAEEEFLFSRFLSENAVEIGKISVLWGCLLLVGAGLTGLLLSGVPSYSEAGGFAKAVVWVVWLAVFGVTVAYKWRLLRSSAEAKGYRWDELYWETMRQYMPVGGSAAVVAVAMTVVLCRLDHAEYLLGLWLMAWGGAVIPMAGRWVFRPILLMGALLLALGFFQVLFWPSYVLTTVVILGLLWLAVGCYLWLTA